MSQKLIGTERSYTGRFYCRGADGPHGHCDRKQYIQCDYCIWAEEQMKNNPHLHEGGKDI